MFKKNKIVRALSYALSAAALGVSSNALAADNPEKNKNNTETEVIEVTGVRGSIMKSLNEKRYSVSLIDGISAEDIGKFPDLNVAESLQRITGVTIDRVDGEGQRVSIRGLSGNFVLTTINGRTMATDTGSRSFSFDTMASELIAGADVYKSTEARLSEGGIGGLVNIKTARPLDSDEGFKSIVSFKNFYNELPEKNSPEGFAQFSYNDGGEFGLSGSISYQDRFSRVDKIDFIRWEKKLFAYTGSFDPAVAPGIDMGLNKSPVTGDFDPRTDLVEAWGPEKIYNEVDEQTRTRLGGNFVAQWAPTDSVTFTLDGIYSSFDIESSKSQFGHFLVNRAFYDVEVSEHNSLMAFTGPPRLQDIPGIDNTGYEPGLSATSGINSVERDMSMFMIGFNADWYISDELQAVFDLSISEAESNGKGLTINLPTAKPLQTPTHVRFDNDTYSYSNQDLVADPAGYMLHVRDRRGNNNDDGIVESKLDFVWTPGFELGDDISMNNIKAGVAYSNREFDVNYYRTPSDAATITVGFRAPIPGQFLKTYTPVNFMKDQGGLLVRSWVKYDDEGLSEYMYSDPVLLDVSTKTAMVRQANGDIGSTPEDLRADIETLMAEKQALVQAGGDKNVEFRPGESYGIEEETISFYISSELSGDVKNMPWSLDLGLRYTTTETFSNSWDKAWLGTFINNSNIRQDIINNSDVDVLTGEGEYSKLLPSLNLKLDITDQLVARFSANKTLTRAGLRSLTPNVNIFTQWAGETYLGGTISGQNPELEPIISTNYDIALNWYIDEASHTGIAYFTKDLSNWIAGSNGVEYRYDPGTDQELKFDTSKPYNIKETSVSGLEFSYSQSFVELPGLFSGLGVQANISFIDSEAEYDPNAVEQNVVMTGISDKFYNLIAFYDKDDITARIAYNFRGEYARRTGLYAESVEDYGQLDFSSTYKLNDNITFSFDIVNLTGEIPRTYSVHRERLIDLVETGTRYIFGARASF